MNIRTFPCGALSSNCYVIESENEMVIIDPGFLEKPLVDCVIANADKIRYILITHGHFDHVSAVSYIKNATCAKIVIGTDDENGLFDSDFNLSNFLPNTYPAVPRGLYADILVDDGDELSFGGVKISVLATPGHSAGGVCYKMGNCLFSGDTLFKNSVGRTDFPGSNTGDMINSLNRLMMLDDSVVVYPGHGETTTIGFEREWNPYIER